jgi:DNA-binding NarL/FixJ family response regulator
MKTTETKSVGKKARILIVDDHPVVRKGLSYLIQKEPDLSVCGECEEGGDVLSSVINLKPDVVVVDLFLKDMNGIDLIKEIRKHHPNVSVLVLSMQDEAVYAERVFRAGAMGYISKDEMLEKVVSALRRILRGEMVATEAIKTKLLKKISRPSQSDDSVIDRLSDRELEVFQLLGQGYSTRRIAERWHRSIKTVETYRAHIKQKLELADSSELVHFAVKWTHDNRSS